MFYFIYDYNYPCSVYLFLVFCHSYKATQCRPMAVDTVKHNLKAKHKVHNINDDAMSSQ